MRLVFALLIASTSLGAADFASAFDAANKMYEQRKFEDAATKYEELTRAGAGSPIVFFNLGNAWYKAGQLGRAIAAYREAQRLAPRDPNVRFNLQFVRKQVTGSEHAPGPAWQQWLMNLTLDEWTIAATVALWLLFVLLALSEIRASLRGPLRIWTIAAALAFVTFASVLGAAIYYRQEVDAAVVVVPNTVVRYGPLEESQVFYQLRDGSELQVLDEKKTAENQSWLMVQDAARRTGWLKRQEVVVLNGKVSRS